MSGTKIFQQVGAWICALIGAFSILIVVMTLRQNAVGSDALALIPISIYALLAFVPFLAFVYPRLKTPRKAFSLSVSVIEILVLGLFLLAILTIQI